MRFPTSGHLCNHHITVPQRNSLIGLVWPTMPVRRPATTTNNPSPSVAPQNVPSPPHPIRPNRVLNGALSSTDTTHVWIDLGLLLSSACRFCGRHPLIHSRAAAAVPAMSRLGSLVIVLHTPRDPALHPATTQRPPSDRNAAIKRGKGLRGMRWSAAIMESAATVLFYLWH